MSKAELTKNLIIKKAAPLFNKKGYAGTSLSDLMEVTGLTKGSIYGNFLNKDDLTAAVYEYNVTNLRRNISDAFAQKQSAQGKLNAFTDFYRKNWKTIFEN